MSLGAEQWRPKEIIIHESVKDDPITRSLSGSMPWRSGQICIQLEFRRKLSRVSEVLSQAKGGMLDKILLGKTGGIYCPCNGCSGHLYDA